MKNEAHSQPFVLETYAMTFPANQYLSDTTTCPGKREDTGVPVPRSVAVS